MTDIKILVPITNGIGKITTKKITGELDCVLLRLDFGALKIESEFGYVLFDSKEVKGIEYLPIRTQPVDKNHHRLNFQSCKFNLNEKLIITVRKYVNYNKDDVKMILRVE